MKHQLPITLNFAARDHRLSFQMTGVLIGLCGLLTVSIAVMLANAASLGAKRTALERQSAELETRAEKLRPVMEQRERLLHDLESMSGLVQARSFSWTRMLTGIEKVFPTGAALEKLKYDEKNRSLTVEGKARSPEALRNFMAGLEQSPFFSGPLLKHQSVDKGILTFTVGVRYQ